MPKKNKMHGKSPEVGWLADFLNLDLQQAKSPGSILSDMAFPLVNLADKATATVGAFAKAHDLGGFSPIRDAHRDLRPLLNDLIDPESIIPIHATKPVREKIKREVVDRYLSDPERPLRLLLRHLKEHAIKTEWTLRSTTASKANLHLRGRHWHFERNPFSTRDKIYQWLATVLERDELSNLGHCRTCQRFFIRSRPWQKDCSPECKKNYDNILSAERKAAAATKRQYQNLAKQKKNLENIISSGDFRRRLPGGMRQQATTQTELIRHLHNCDSVQEFYRTCKPECRRIIQAIIVN
jgi:hypothetical protein